jgi:hypothetical protein
MADRDNGVALNNGLGLTLEDLEEYNKQAVGISCDSVDAHCISNS